MPNTEYLKRLKELLKLEKATLALHEQHRASLLGEVNVVQDYIKSTQNVIDNIERQLRR